MSASTARWRSLWRVIVALFMVLSFSGERPATSQGGGFSLRFFGNGRNDIDRVKISIDGPHRPVDVSGDFTVEWWMKAALADNPSSSCSEGNDNWIFGNILLDRDVFWDGDHGDWGVSVRGGVIAFGVNNGSTGDGICGSSEVADDQWHHVAVSRRRSDGRLQIWVDGVLDRQRVTGVTGDVSYRDGRDTSYAADPYLVLGAEKHDAGADFPSYNGFLDELRISDTLRYSASFAPPTTPFLTDADTVGLFHFDEGAGNLVADSSGADGGPSNGQRRFGGTPSGPVWSTETPFEQSSPTIFQDGFESGDLSAWSSIVGRALAVVRPGLSGTDHALAIDLAIPERKAFLKSRHARRADSIAVDFLVRIEEAELPEGGLEILRLIGPGAHVKLKLEASGRNYQVAAWVKEDSGSFSQIGQVRFAANRTVHLAVEWQRATGPTVADGQLRVLRNGKKKLIVTGLQNDRFVVSQVWFGMIRGKSGQGTNGTILLDEFVVSRWIS